MNRTAIIADDLTGASDTGIKLVQRGYHVNVAFNIDNAKEMMNHSHVLAINTSSRETQAAIAYQKVFELTKALAEAGFQHLFKKVDSVFRGHEGTEIEAMMEALQINCCLLVPAIPKNGRIIKSGCLQVGGDESVSKDVKVLLESSGSMRVENIRLEEIRKKDFSLVKRITSQRNDDKVVYLFDTDTYEDLQLISEHVSQVEESYILAGASGIATFLPDIWQTAPTKNHHPKHLVVAGSYHDVTAGQVRHLLNSRRCELIIIDTKKGFEDQKQRSAEIEAVTEKLRHRQCEETILVAVDSLIDETNSEIDEKKSMQIAAHLSKMVQKIVDSNQFKSLTVCGGETAHSVMKQLNAKGMALTDEIISGIPVGNVIGGMADGMILVTKSGGFGNIDAFELTMKYLDDQTRS